MSVTTTTVMKESHQEAEMAMQNSSGEVKKMNSGLCTSAGIKTPSDADENRFQRRHFPNKTTSDIFFCDLPMESNDSSGNITDQNDSYCELAAVKISAGIETRNTDEKQSERRHFHLPAVDYIMSEENGVHNEDNQVDSSGTVDSKENETGDDDEIQKTQRRHFYDKTSSNIFFSGVASEDGTERDPANPSDFRKRKS